MSLMEVVHIPFFSHNNINKCINNLKELAENINLRLLLYFLHIGNNNSLLSFKIIILVRYLLIFRTFI
jgi:hypothetical protein